jgi:hypothetical protein
MKRPENFCATDANAGSSARAHKYQKAGENRKLPILGR